MEIITKKLFINLFTTLFISGAALSFLLATRPPVNATQAEKYILFEHCKPYYDMSAIPKTLDESRKIKDYKQIKVNESSLSLYEDVLYRSVMRIYKAKGNNKTSNDTLLWLPTIGIFNYGYYRNGALIMFQIFPHQDINNQSIYCKYNAQGQLTELSYSNLNGYIDYNYKGRILKVKSFSGFGE